MTSIIPLFFESYVALSLQPTLFPQSYAGALSAGLAGKDRWFISMKEQFDLVDRIQGFSKLLSIVTNFASTLTAVRRASQSGAQFALVDMRSKMAL